MKGSREMKIGLSSYSLSRAIGAKEISVLEAMQWTAEHGGEHFEVVPIGYELTKGSPLIAEIRAKAQETGLELSNLAVGGNLLQPSDAEYEQEIRRLCDQVDLAHELGIKLMRHDIAFLPPDQATVERFETELPRLVDGCRRVADYAAQYGITTSIENHGFFVQLSERVLRIVQAVGRPNFKTTMDIGNFACADEPSLSAVKRALPYASMIHVKDFYVRPEWNNPGEGWFRSAGGSYLRGAIVGQGDLPVREILQYIRKSGYNGYLSLEFEGLEDCFTGSRYGLNFIRSVLSQA
jgi:sugar phosphate isomerase/epimerase